LAAFLLLVLAVGGGVVVADLARENTTVGVITVFHQPVTGYPVGWLLAAAAGLGFVVAMLLAASWSSATGRARRRELRRRQGQESRLAEPERDRDQMLDEFFGPDEAPRRVVRPPRPAHLRSDRREGRARHDQSWDAAERVRYHSEPIYEQATRAARPHDDADYAYPARDGRLR
jgi:hypothetical protein